MPAVRTYTGFMIGTVMVSSVLSAQHQEFHLEIGDPARKGQEAALVLDAVTDTRTMDNIVDINFNYEAFGVIWTIRIDRFIKWSS